MQINSRTTQPEDVMRCTGGIRDPFAHALHYFQWVAHHISQEEQDKFVAEVVKTSKSSLFEPDLKRELTNQTLHFLVPVIKQFGAKLNQLAKLHGKRYKGKDLGCRCERKEFEATITFHEGTKDAGSIQLNLVSIYEATYQSLRFPELLLASYQGAKDFFEYSIVRLATKNEVEKKLFLKSYFEFYLKQEEKGKSKYSLRRALEDANDKYHFYDSNSKMWIDNFETIHGNFKKWKSRIPSDLIELKDYF